MENRNNGKGVFYGVIGVATLVVAIIGATFAYFTASAGNNATITGNMATVRLALEVDKVTTVDESKGGMIPMSNGMVEAAVNDTENMSCVDDNGNAVCQVYRITLKNDSSAGQFVDGYVALKYGSGAPTDIALVGDSGYTWTGSKFDNTDKEAGTNTVATTMRWAQVFPNTNGSYLSNGTATTETDYSTGGTQALGAGTGEAATLTTIGAATATASDNADTRAEKAHNVSNIKVAFDDVKTTLGISGTDYDVIGRNYIRISDHTWDAAGGAESYDRTTDITSALVFNHNIPANSEAVYYIVVWLSETGTDQTAQTGTNAPAGPLSFFNGNVTFVSAQGSEVSATFAGYSRVNSQAAGQ